ncbi:MAG: B3/4 domain-containing protein [Saprospiraceae bacterium]
MQKNYEGYPYVKVSALVDIINIVSIQSGFSIGAFDFEKIQGDIELDVGKQDDFFEAIGRGVLNIDGLPLLKDSYGPIGTPTSDNIRTKLDDNTKKIIIIIYNFAASNNINIAIETSIYLLSTYANLQNYNIEIID